MYSEKKLEGYLLLLGVVLLLAGLVKGVRWLWALV